MTARKRKPHPCVLVTGNPVDGLEMVGPFPNELVATAHGDVNYDHTTWWVAKLVPPGEQEDLWLPRRVRDSRSLPADGALQHTRTRGT